MVMDLTLVGIVGNQHVPKKTVTYGRRCCSIVSFPAKHGNVDHPVHPTPAFDCLLCIWIDQLGGLSQYSQHVAHPKCYTSKLPRLSLEVKMESYAFGGRPF